MDPPESPLPYMPATATVVLYAHNGKPERKIELIGVEILEADDNGLTLALISGVIRPPAPENLRQAPVTDPWAALRVSFAKDGTPVFPQGATPTSTSAETPSTTPEPKPEDRAHLVAQPEPEPEPEPESEPESELPTLSDTVAEIREAGQTISTCTASRIRYQLTLWCAELRAASEHNAVAWFGHLTAIGQTLWPGYTPALRYNANLADCTPYTDVACSSWADVARVLRQKLDDVTFLDWKDEAYLEPAAQDPAAILAHVDTRLRALFGGTQPAISRVTLACETVFGAAPDLNGEIEKTRKAVVEELHLLAAQLRWIRPHAEPNQWGTLMGFLRWIGTYQIGDTFAARISDDYVPPRSWAHMVAAPEVVARHAALTAPKAPAEPQALTEWFLRYAPALTAADIVTHYGPTYTPVFLELQKLVHIDALFSGSDQRSLRAKFNKVMKRISLNAATKPEVVAEPSEPEDALTAIAAAEPPNVARARIFLEGKKGAFITNRAEPEHTANLSARFGCQIEGVILEHSKSGADRLRLNNWDFVLAATGFMSHSADGKISRACKGAGIPYYRAGKGRLLACANAVLAAHAAS